MVSIEVSSKSLQEFVGKSKNSSINCAISNLDTWVQVLSFVGTEDEFATKIKAFYSEIIWQNLTDKDLDEFRQWWREGRSKIESELYFDSPSAPQPKNHNTTIPDVIRPTGEPPFNLELRPMVLRVDRVDVTTEPDVSMFNPEQQHVYDTVLGVLRGETEYDHVLITGPAGTGKTFVTQKIIHRLLNKNPDLRIAMAAPTHKAVSVSRNMSPFQNNQKEYQWEEKDRKQMQATTVNYVTVHKILGLIPQRNEKTGWEEKFLPNPKLKPDEIPILAFDVVFVDEAGMLDGGEDGLLTKLMKHKGKVLFVFIGDEAQIEPVESAGVKSPVFIHKYRERERMAHVALKTVMRQALDNPVLALATSVRETGEYARQNSQSESGRVLFVPRNNAKAIAKRDMEQAKAWENDVDELIWHVFGSEHFEINSDYAKILAYNVDEVESWNTKVRQVLHDRRGGTEKLKRIEKGDKLILGGPYMEYGDDDQKQVKYPNFTELSVFGYHETTQHLPTPMGGSFELRCYVCSVIWVDPNTGQEDEGELRVLHEDEQDAYKRLVDQWYAYCDVVRKGMDKRTIADAYRKKSDVETHFAKFGYNFALTVHRSQGSSFQFTLLAEGNIRQMKYKPMLSMQYKSIMYVAASRARYCCIMIGKP